MTTKKELGHQQASNASLRSKTAATTNPSKGHSKSQYTDGGGPKTPKIQQSSRCYDPRMTISTDKFEQGLGQNSLITYSMSNLSNIDVNISERPKIKSNAFSVHSKHILSPQAMQHKDRIITRPKKSVSHSAGESTEYLKQMILRNQEQILNYPMQSLQSVPSVCIMSPVS